MRVASTVIDITPTGEFYMEGYIHPSRRHPAAGVHDAPLAVLLLLEEGGERVLFCSIDVCMVSESRTRLLRQGLSEATGVPEESIVISGIHSHSCPKGFEDGNSIEGVPPTYGFREMATGRAIEAATRLEGKLVEAAPELLRTHVRGWYSNRNDAERPFDDEVFLLRFVTDDGDVAGAMLNFNCHATVVGPLNPLLTTDVIGGVRAELAEWVGCVPYTFTGASADLGNRQFRQGNDFAELRRVSNGIAHDVMQASFEPVELGTPQVRWFQHDVAYNNEDFYPEYQRQLDEVDAVLAGDPTFDEKKLADTEKMMLEKQLERHEMSFPIRMQLVELGDVVFATFPGELASDLGAMIKGAFPGRVPIVIGYANDYQGYFVPAADFGGTSYESYVTQMPKGWTEKVLEEFAEWATA